MAFLIAITENNKITEEEVTRIVFKDHTVLMEFKDNFLSLFPEK